VEIVERCRRIDGHQGTSKHNAGYRWTEATRGGCGCRAEVTRRVTADLLSSGFAFPQKGVKDTSGGQNRSDQNLSDSC
jgi:hypothetical protein